MIKTNDMVIIMSATGSGKTAILGIGYSLWLASNFENKQVLIVSNEKEQAKKLLERIVDTIDDNEYLSKLRPPESRGPSGSWNKFEINLTTKCKIFCKAYTPNLRSYHVDFVLADEVAQYRDHTIFMKWLITRVTAKRGKVVGISTPIHLLDLPHKLIDNPQFVGKIYPAKKDSALSAKFKPKWKSVIYDNMKEGEPVFPTMYTPERLEQIKNTIGSIAFDREYMCHVLSIEDSLYPPEFVAECFDETLQFQDVEIGRCFIGIDLAVGSGKDADYCVFTVIENNGQKYIIRRIERYHGMPMSAQIERIEFLTKQYNPVSVNIDSSHVGEFLIQELRSKNLPVMGFKFDPKSRTNYLMQLRKIVEDKSLVIPRKADGNSIELTDRLFIEMTSFIPYQTPSGFETYTCTADHDDMCMSLSLSIATSVGLELPQTDKIFYYSKPKSLNTENI